MKVKDFIDFIIENNIPQDAIIYSESDHGQTPEQAGHYLVTADKKLPYSSDEIIWQCLADFWDNGYKTEDITAVLV